MMADAPIRIAILDSDAVQLASLSLTLAAYRCESFSDPAELRSHAPPADLLLLDLKTLQTDTDAATALIAAARAASRPVLLSVGRSEMQALEAAFDAGATDYVLKPLRLNEVLLRVQLLLKRAYPHYQAQQQIRFAQYVFETPSHRVTRGEAAIDMTQKEFELALLLFRNLGRPLSRATIQNAIWARDSDLPSRTMDTHISRVRNKLQLKPENGFRLTPVYGYGYQLEQLTK
ncbi:MAG: response regulator transcription factor [Herbaspirillum sp.]|nr:response regulator transcription factor [Herbaspirillum sp.]